MKSGIKMMARERKKKKLTTNHFEATNEIKKFMSLTFHSPIVKTISCQIHNKSP